MPSHLHFLIITKRKLACHDWAPLLVNTLKVGGTPADREEALSQSQGLNLNTVCQRDHLYNQQGFEKWAGKRTDLSCCI